MAGAPTKEGIAELRERMNDANKVVTTEDARMHYGRDWSRRQRPAPSAVVFPTCTHDVSTVLRWAHANDVAVVPSGGRTGLAGGAVAADGEVVLSMERMRQMGDVDTVGQLLWVEAGAVTQSVHEHAAKAGLFWPVDFASKGSSQIGGNLSTNAGGVRVVRYGSASKWVRGLEVVLADGRVIRTGTGLEKDNTGLDLGALFLRSEGTLGIICSATLKLCARPQPSATIFVATPSLHAASSLFLAARQAPFELAAFEVLTEPCLDVVTRRRSLARPFQARSPVYALIEFEAGKGAPAIAGSDALGTWLSQQVGDGLVDDGVIGDSSQKATALWALREGISESLSARGRVHKNDVSVPVKDVPAFVQALGDLYGNAAPDLEVYIFGHMGDGNLHLNLVAPDAEVGLAEGLRVLSDAAFFAQAKAADAVVYPLIASFGGSVSAEHGVGTLKRDALSFTRGPVERALMADIKRTLDPKGILNPGKILDVTAP